MSRGYPRARRRVEHPHRPPIANTRAYILDAALEPVPAGIAGELYLGGPGVAAGYLNNPEATAAAFIRDPFSGDPSGRLYKTGDLARWLEDGAIDFLGRADNQLKIRGFRVEPGEIEAALLRHPRVRQAVIIPRPDSAGQKQLAAYIVPQPGAAPTTAELREHLLGSLPDYMAPAAFAFLDALPLNANGKVDLAALAAIPLVAAERIHEEPATWMEASLVEIWEEMLGHRPIGVTEDFFELGGHSLLAVRMLSEVEKRTGIRVSPKVLFDGTATIRHLAAVISEERETLSPLVKVKPDGAKPPLIFFHGDLQFGGLYLANLARYLPPDRPCYSVEPHRFDGSATPPTIEEMAASRLETILEVQPDEPYYLGGFCNGGLVAFQTAQLLRARGKVVACVVLLGANGINSRFRLLKRLVAAVARMRGLDQAAERELFLQWRRRFLFGAVLVRHHFNELKGGSGSPPITRVWAKMKSFTGWLLRRAGVKSTRPSANNPAEPVGKAIENLDGPTWDLHTNAVSCFVPGRYDGKVFLFKETDLPPDLAWIKSDLGWRKVVKDLSIHDLPGNHLTITARSNIGIFAEQLKVCLDQAEAATSSHPQVGSAAS